MDATKGNIYAILNGNKQFLIPVYQRYYSWDIYDKNGYDWRLQRKCTSFKCIFS